MIIIDIGAHVGTFIDLHLDATVYAFEPNPINYGFLMAKYADKPNIHIYNIAISHEHGTIRLYRYSNDGSGRLTETGRSSTLLDNRDVVEDRFWDVTTTRLTTFMHENRIPHVDILKIDTEGAEYDILEDLIKSKTLNHFGEILYEDHSFLFDAEYAKRANAVTRRLYTEHPNPHKINNGNVNTPWSSEVPFVRWRLEFPL